MNADEWIATILEGKGRAPLSSLLEKRVALAELRRIATTFGLKPKGYRVERAGAAKLCGLLAEHFDRSEELRKAIGALLAASDEPCGADGRTAPSPAEDSREHLKRLQQVLSQLKERSEKERTSAAKARKSTQTAVRQRESAERRVLELERELREKERNLANMRDETRTMRELLSEQTPAGAEPTSTPVEDYDELRAREKNARRRIAELTSQVRALEQEVTELESLLPRGQRERRKLRQRDTTPVTSIVLPRLTDEFLRSVSAMDTEQQRRVFAALARLVLHGFDYPALHAKALKGKGGLMSIRASEGLRVYLRRDGDAAVFEGAATREEQATYLKNRRDG